MKNENFAPVPFRVFPVEGARFPLYVLRSGKTANAAHNAHLMAESEATEKMQGSEREKLIRFTHQAAHNAAKSLRGAIFNAGFQPDTEVFAALNEELQKFLDLENAQRREVETRPRFGAFAPRQTAPRSQHTRRREHV